MSRWCLNDMCGRHIGHYQKYFYSGWQIISHKTALHTFEPSTTHIHSVEGGTSPIVRERCSLCETDCVLRFQPIDLSALSSFNNDARDFSKVFNHFHVINTTVSTATKSFILNSRGMYIWNERHRKKRYLIFQEIKRFTIATNTKLPHFL